MTDFYCDYQNGDDTTGTGTYGYTRDFRDFDVEETEDPFVDAASGDYRLKSTSLSATASIVKGFGMGNLGAFECESGGGGGETLHPLAYAGGPS